MANERLRGCLAAAELTTVDLAAHVGVDVKTVERWIAKGRVPYRSHRRRRPRCYGPRRRSCGRRC